ncbi:hypothetical protein ACQKDB_12620 [Planococcus kocurii]|uniref:hypothetical protein n=1 Tax=Planococcus kocurii TaxID=1374 RepID=UPI003D023917
MSAAFPIIIDTVFTGQVVESLEGTPGIVHQVNKRTIDFSLASGVLVSGSPTLFKPSDCVFRKARKIRNSEEKQNNVWAPGIGGNIMTDFGPAPVIIVKE